MPEVSSLLPIGATVDGDRYQIVRVLGQGSFGTTYEATDIKLGRSVALKELAPSAGDRARSRFLEEACALARFTHPGIVRVHDVFEDAGAAYVVMELVRGRSLADLLVERGGRLPPTQAVACVRRIAEALAVVHEAGMLHRDVKPANVLVADDGRIVLIDFGAARDFVAGERGDMTQVLTPGYAPLEQYGSAGPFGPATDLYALGATAYHLLAGERPPSAPDRLQGVRLTPLAELDPAIPVEVSAAVDWALAVRAEERPQHARAFVSALRRAADGGAAPATVQMAAAPATIQVAAPTGSGTELYDDRAAPDDAEDGDGWDDAAPPRRRLVLPVALGLGALCAIAPVIVVATWVLAVLPLVNAAAGVRRGLRERRELRGPRWWDPLGAPPAFVARFLWGLVVAGVRTFAVLLVLGMLAAVGVITADLDATAVGDALRTPAGRAGLGLAGGLGLAVVVPSLLRTSDAYVGHLHRIVRVPEMWRLPAWAAAVLLVLVAVAVPLSLFPLDLLVPEL